MIIGYCQASLLESAATLRAQERALAGIGAERFFAEKTGLRGDTDELERAIASAQKGDVIAVTRPYRVARTTRGVLELINRLGERGIGFRILNTPVDTSTTTGRMILGSVPIWTLGMSPVRSAILDICLGWARSGRAA